MREWSTNITINNNPSNPQQPIHSLRKTLSVKTSRLHPQENHRRGKSDMYSTLGEISAPRVSAVWVLGVMEMGIDRNL